MTNESNASPLQDAIKKAGTNRSRLRVEHGISPSTLLRLESGTTSAPRRHLRERLAVALGLTLEELDGIITLTVMTARATRGRRRK